MPQQLVDLEGIDADQENTVRLDLLARRFTQGYLSPADDARLTLATERVRLLIPRVTAEDWHALEVFLRQRFGHVPVTVERG